MTDKQKNIALLLGFVFFLFLSYKFSIQKTIQLKRQWKELRKEKELLSNANERILNLQWQNSYFDSILTQKELSIENSFQQTLFQNINRFSEKGQTEIISFEEPHRIVENTTRIDTYIFEVKGTFRDLLVLTNSIEKSQLGELVSAHFEKKKNYRKNQEELTGKFYIEKLSSIK